MKLCGKDNTKSTINMRKYLILITSIIFGIMVSCHRQVNCPSFDEEILSWIPYQENDVIELHSQSVDTTIIFSIERVEVTHKTHYTAGAKCGTCDDDIQIIQKSHDNFEFSASIAINNNKKKDKKITQSYRIGDAYFSTYSESKNVLFEGENYDIVRIFEKTDSNGMFKKLIIAKEFGIIGLVDIYDNVWTLKIKRHKKNENIIINNTSC